MIQGVGEALGANRSPVASRLTARFIGFDLKVRQNVRPESGPPGNWERSSIISSS